MKYNNFDYIISCKVYLLIKWTVDYIINISFNIYFNIKFLKKRQ